MLDIINLRGHTTVECSLNDLPSLITERIKSFLTKDELPLLCIVSKGFQNEVEIFAVSPFCAIYLVNQIQNGKLLTDTPSTESDRCILISEIIGVKRKVWENNLAGSIDLICSSHELDPDFVFRDFDLLRKFESVVFSVIRQARRA